MTARCLHRHQHRPAVRLPITCKGIGLAQRWNLRNLMLSARVSTSYLHQRQEGKVLFMNICCPTHVPSTQLINTA